MAQLRGGANARAPFYRKGIILSISLAAVFVLALFLARVYFAGAKGKPSIEPILVELTRLAENLGVTTGVDLVTSSGPFVGTQGAVVKQGDILVTCKGSLRVGEHKHESPVVIVDPALPLGSNVEIITSRRYVDVHGDSASAEPVGVNFESSLPWIANYQASVSVIGIGGTNGFTPGIPVDGPTLTGVFTEGEDIIDGKRGLEYPTAIDFGGVAPDEDLEDNLLFFVAEEDGRIMGVDFTDGVFTVVREDEGLMEPKDITFIPDTDADGEPIPGTGTLYVVGRVDEQGVVWVIDVTPSGPIGEDGTLVEGHVERLITFERNLIKKPVGLEMSKLGTLLIAEERGDVFEINASIGGVIHIFDTGLRVISAVDVGDIDGGSGEEVLITDLTTASLYAFDLGPELIIIKPKALEFVSGAVTIEALAADPDGVERVNFYADTDGDGEADPDELFQTDYIADGDLFTAEFISTEQPDAELTFIVEAIDSLGLKTLQSVTVTIDNTPPIITDLFPPSGTFTNNPLLTISANYSDNLSGIDKETAMVTLDGEDVTSDSVVTESGVSFTPSSPLEDGAHTATIDISDKAGNPGSQAVTSFTVDTVPPGPPDLGKISVSLPEDGNVTVTGEAGAVEPGSTVTITNTATGETVTVTANEDGSFSATIAASSGDSLSIVAIDHSGNTSNPTTIDVIAGGFIHGMVYNAATDGPLAGAGVTVKGITGEVLSDEEGNFIFPTPDGGTFDVTIGKEGYTFVQRKAEVIRGRDTAIEPAYLTPLDTKTTLVSPTEETVVTDSTGSVELTFPAGAVSEETEVRATSIEKLEDLPGVQPEWNVFISSVKLEPDGLTLDKPVTVRAKCSQDFPPGLEVPLTFWNKETLTWDEVAVGYVSSDGKWIEFTVTHFSNYHFNIKVKGTGPTGGIETSEQLTMPCTEAKNLGNSGVSYRRGTLIVDHSLPAVRTLGISKSLTLSYKSDLAYPNLLVGSYNDQTNVKPDKRYWIFNMEGIREDIYFMGTLSKTWQRFLWDARNGRGEIVKTGSYPYTITLSDIWDSGIFEYRGAWIPLGTPVAFSITWTGRAIVINEIESPFGAGWTLNGLYRLHFDPDGYILLTQGGGWSKLFTPSDGTSYSGPPGDPSTLVKNADDTFMLTERDGNQVHFDSEGLHLTSTDRNGNISTFLYDSQRRLTSITDPVGQVTEFTYDGSGYLSSVTDPAGRTTEFHLDEAGNLVSITDPDGGTTHYSYDEKHLLTSKKDPRNNTTKYHYNEFGRISQVIHPTGEIRKFTPGDTQHLINSLPLGTQENPAPATPYPTDIFIDGKGYQTTMKTDKYGNIIEEIDPLGRTTTYERNDWGAPTKIIRLNGSVITMTYDSNGNILTFTEKSISATTTFTYEPNFNQVTSITDPKGNKTVIDYDTHGNPTKITDAMGNETHMAYDPRGLLTTITDALSNVTTFDYDPKGNLVKTTDPLGNETSLAYDDTGNVISYTDAEGRTTQFAYDLMNRLTSVTDTQGGITAYEYDANGNLTKVIDANGHETTFAYDKVNQLTSITDPLGHSETFSYDYNRNLASTTNRNGQTIDFEYDAVNQLVKKTLPGNILTVFQYDVSGNLGTASNPGYLVTMEYDEANRLVQIFYDDLTGPPPIPTTITEDTTISAHNKHFDDTLLTIDACTVTMNGSHSFQGLTLKNGAVLTHSGSTTTTTSKLDLSITTTLTIDSTSKIDATGKGYLGGRTLGNTTEGGSTGRAGGSYGGLGGIHVYGGGSTNSVYGNFRNPNELGSGGGGSPGKNGGGLIRINTSEIILDGAILANGEGYPGSSGGGIFIRTDTLTGSGAISANGGISSYRAGGGGGGRIAIYYSDISGFDTSNITAFGGERKEGGTPGGAGTVFLKSTTQAYGDLIVDNGGRGAPDDSTPLYSVGPGSITELDADILTDANASFLPDSLVGLELNPNTNQDRTFTVVDNDETTITTDPADGDMTEVASVGDTYMGVLTIDNLEIQNSSVTVVDGNTENPRGAGSINANNLSLTQNGMLSHQGSTTSTSSCLLLDVNTLTIDSTSKIDATGKGYLGGRTLGNTTEGGSTGRAGGSYGGLGGIHVYGGGSTNSVYGNFRNPNELGSGGGGSPGKNGGGLIRINTSEIILDGAILANGEGYPGSSGGGIFIRTDTLTGSGAISANGGISSYRAGGGGGGRIAIYYSDISGFDTSNITAFGGERKEGGTPGGAGTVFLKSTTQAYGDLIVDNGGRGAPDDSTPLRAVGLGTSTDLTWNVLTDDSANFPVPDPATGALGLIGLKLNPNLDQGQTFTIIDNIATTITTDPADGDMTLVAVTGDSYIGVYTFDNLSVLNGAKVITDDDIIVMGILDTTGGSLKSHNITQSGFLQKETQPVLVAERNSFGLSNKEHSVEVTKASFVSEVDKEVYTRPTVLVASLNQVSSGSPAAFTMKPAYSYKREITRNTGNAAAQKSEDSTSVNSVLKSKSETAGNGCKLDLSDPSYTYDKNGNRLTMTDPTGTTTYTYDELNRLKSITNPMGQTTTFEYDELSRRKKMTLPNGVTTTYTYDATSQLLGLVNQLGAITISRFDYAYDKVSNRTSMTELAGVNNYTYDALNQLIEATHPYPANPLEQFTYDAVGNRLTSTISSSYSYDEANRLKEDDTFLYSYDNNGNMIQKQKKSNGEITTYTYDAENKLTRIDFPDGTYARYRYDALGRRIEKDVNDTLTRYMYDNEDILFELDASNNIIARYTHGPGIDEPISMDRDGQSYFYNRDGLGSVTELTNINGSVVQSYTYDSFGQIIDQTGTISNPYTYTSREHDPESNLYYYRMRYYDAKVGRFLQEDPIGFNLYMYVWNNPVIFIDPYGLCKYEDGRNFGPTNLDRFKEFRDIVKQRYRSFVAEPLIKIFEQNQIPVTATQETIEIRVEIQFPIKLDLEYVLTFSWILSWEEFDIFLSNIARELTPFGIIRNIHPDRSIGPEDNRGYIFRKDIPEIKRIYRK